jgi:hypothetical protein
MYTFFCNVVTLKSGNRVGDLVGIVIKDSEGNKSAISLEEAEELVSQNKIEGLKLEPYSVSDTDGKVVGGGNLIFFENGKPILLDIIAWHKDLAKKDDITVSEKVNEAIHNSCYQ